MADQTTKGVQTDALKLLIIKKAAVGIEPTNKGFADLCLTTWLRRREFAGLFEVLKPAFLGPPEASALEGRVGFARARLKRKVTYYKHSAAVNSAGARAWVWRALRDKFRLNLERRRWVAGKGRRESEKGGGSFNSPSALTLYTRSGRRDLNPRLRPWQGRTLPLSYSRVSI